MARTRVKIFEIKIPRDEMGVVEASQLGIFTVRAITNLKRLSFPCHIECMYYNELLIALSHRPTFNKILLTGILVLTFC